MHVGTESVVLLRSDFLTLVSATAEGPAPQQKSALMGSARLERMAPKVDQQAAAPLTARVPISPKHHL